jgi:hypothetical protein
LDEIKRVYDDITRKAYEGLHERPDVCTLDIEDWLAAEKQLLWKPAIQVIERRDLFVVRVALNLIDPARVDVLATREDVLIQAASNPPHPRVFRAVHFPLPINPLQLHGTYVKGHLVLIAPKISTRNRFERASKGPSNRTLRIAV